MIELLPVSLALLFVALVLGSLDALYFHLWKFRLYALHSSKQEHALHSVRAVLLPFTLWLGFVPGRSTISLVAFGLVELADFGIVIWDVAIEHHSRSALGGLPRSEYLVHIVATTLHSGAIALAFVSWPLAAWMGTAFPIPHPANAVRWAATALAAGATLIGLLHIALLHPSLQVPPPKGMGA